MKFKVLNENCLLCLSYPVFNIGKDGQSCVTCHYLFSGVYEKSL